MQVVSNLPISARLPAVGRRGLNPLIRRFETAKAKRLTLNKFIPLPTTLVTRVGNFILYAFSLSKPLGNGEKTL